MEPDDVDHPQGADEVLPISDDRAEGNNTFVTSRRNLRNSMICWISITLRWKRSVQKRPLTYRMATEDTIRSSRKTNVACR